MDIENNNLLDGDDWLIEDNRILEKINELYIKYDLLINYYIEYTESIEIIDNMDIDTIISNIIDKLVEKIEMDNAIKSTKLFKIYLKNNKIRFKNCEYLQNSMNHDIKLNMKIVNILNNIVNNQSIYSKHLTIIIPVYKLETFTFIDKLTVTLSKYNNIEIIFVNDNPGENKELETYYKKYDNVYLIQNNTNIGAGNSRNRAIPIIQGKYTYFLDADDSININLFLEELNILNKNDYDILFFKYLINGKKPISLNKFKYNVLKNNKRNFLNSLSTPWWYIVKSSIIHENEILFGVTNIHNDINYYILCTYYTNKQYFSNKYIYNYVDRFKNNENCLSNCKDRTNSVYSFYHTYLKLKEINYPYIKEYTILINKLIKWNISIDEKNKHKILELYNKFFNNISSTNVPTDDISSTNKKLYIFRHTKPRKIYKSN